MIEEFKKCAEDFFYFCEKYVKIIHYKHGLIPLSLHPYQRRYVDCFSNNRFTIAKKFRQGGFTTVNVAWLIWRLLFKLDERNMIITRQDRAALEYSRIARTIVRELPDFLRPDFGTFNDHCIENRETNSTVYFYRWVGTRSRSLNHLFIEEAAFMAEMDYCWGSVYPTLSTGGSCVVTSTPNGNYGWFCETYTLDNEFKKFECHYTEHPEYAEQQWQDQTKSNLGEYGWRQEVLCEFLRSKIMSEEE